MVIPIPTDPNIKVINGEEIDDWRDIPLYDGLDDLGEDDWELVAIHWSPHKDEDPIYIFVRPVDDDVWFDVEELKDRLWWR